MTENLIKIFKSIKNRWNSVINKNIQIFIHKSILYFSLSYT